MVSAQDAARGNIGGGSAPKHPSKSHRWWNVIKIGAKYYG